MARKTRVPYSVRLEIAKKYGGGVGMAVEVQCHYCLEVGTVSWVGRPGTKGWFHFHPLEMDHVVPEFMGGETTAENIVLACRTCNRSKGIKTAPKRRGHWPASAQ